MARLLQALFAGSHEQHSFINCKRTSSLDVRDELSYRQLCWCILSILCWGCAEGGIPIYIVSLNKVPSAYLEVSAIPCDRRGFNLSTFFMLHLFLVTPSQARALLSAQHRRHLASAPYSAVEGVCRKAQAPTGEMAILVELFLNLGWPTQTYLGA